MKLSALLATVLLVAACSKKDEPKNDPPKTTEPGKTDPGKTDPGKTDGSGSATTMKSDGSGSGSATMKADGSGSAAMKADGSGSADMKADGSGSAMKADGSGSATPSAGSGSGSGSGSAAKTGFDFKKLSHDEQVAFMKEKVMPAMKAEFQKFDAKKFASFTCKTCHGKDPKASNYKMPNPELPKLDFAALKAGKQEPKIAEWMGKVVTPGMAAIFQVEPHSEKNPNGFGCLACHEMKK